MGYAACKEFKEVLPKSDLSSRLVNPVQRFEQYPQPKPKIDKNYTMDIRPSELETPLRGVCRKLVAAQVS